MTSLDLPIWTVHDFPGQAGVITGPEDQIEVLRIFDDFRRKNLLENGILTVNRNVIGDGSRTKWIMNCPFFFLVFFKKKREISHKLAFFIHFTGGKSWSN